MTPDELKKRYATQGLRGLGLSQLPEIESRLGNVGNTALDVVLAPLGVASADPNFADLAMRELNVKLNTIQQARAAGIDLNFPTIASRFNLPGFASTSGSTPASAPAGQFNLPQFVSGAVAQPAPATFQQPTSGLGSVAETNRLLGGNYFDVATGKQIATPPPMPSTSTQVSTTTITPPFTPVPQATQVADTYLTSVAQNLANVTAALTAATDKRIADTNTQIVAAQKTLDDLRTQQKGAIDQQGQLAQDEANRKLDLLTEEKNRFDTNYNTVQGLASQLQTLLTTGNALIEQQKNQAGLSAIITPRINQTISNVASQAGVIQAAISVYNGQMSQAQSQLTTATNVVTSAYQDQLDYYTTLQDFYKTASTETGQKLITLTSDQKTFLNSQISTLKDNMKLAQTNVENIKNAMMDPNLALAYAQAGITLNDTPAQINQNLAQYGYSKELADLSKTMAKEGASPLLPGQSIPPGSVPLQQIDSKGVVHNWYKAKITSLNQPVSNLFTPAKIAQMSVAGLSADDATLIYQAIVNGNSLEDIRQALITDGKDPALLDVFDRVNNIQKILGQ